MQKFDENHASEVMLMAALKIKFQHFSWKFTHTVNYVDVKIPKVSSLGEDEVRLCSISINNRGKIWIDSGWMVLFAKVTINKTEYQVLTQEVVTTSEHFTVKGFVSCFVLWLWSH